MKKLFLAVAILCVLGFIATFPIQSNFHGKAKLIQRIEKSAGSELFGDEGTPIGDPMMLIVEDPKAFVGEPDAKGVYKVDESYLKQNNIYPTQLKSIDFFAQCFKIGFAVAALVSGFIYYRLGLKQAKTN
jgi:uncharacterized membrane protein YciS (DUF1049 family)